MIGFERRADYNDNLFNTSLIGIQNELNNKQIERLKRLKRSWNFYEGYHWEEIPEQDTPELTINYCRSFVDKFVAFELGKAFTINMKPEHESIKVTPDGRTLFKFLEDVWVDNNQYLFATEMGQMKSVTGEAWVQVRYSDPEELDDPYNEYPDGRIEIILMNSSVVFPEFDPHQKGKLTSLTIMYTYEHATRSSILGKLRRETRVYKQVWTKDQCAIYDGKEDPVIIPNRYKTIPFIQIKNISVAGRNEGRGDLEDVIPLNTEYNMKESNVSEIIDYHSAPVTIVYGAKIGNLEKGANKMWGGLAKDAKVENLELKSDLGASSAYIKELKKAMCEVGGVPETVLGGAQNISNTSGVALQYINLPLVEKTRLKRMSTEDGLERINKLILLVALSEGLITKPQTMTTREFFFNEVKLADTLPKDMLLELQQIQLEMRMGLESRIGAMKRMGKENIEQLIEQIDKDRKENPEIYGVAVDEPQLNSGFTNGETPIETVRKEMTGQNGGAQ